MNKKMVAALLGCSMCCAAAAAPAPQVAESRYDPVLKTVPTGIGAAAQTEGRRGVPHRHEANRPLGRWGIAYLLLAGGGALAITIAGYLLIASRRSRRDAAYLCLGALGYALLIVAAFGLILLMR